MNSLSMLTPAMMLYRMIGSDGGNRSPRLPDVVTSPSENFSGYFCL